MRFLPMTSLWSRSSQGMTGAHYKKIIEKQPAVQIEIRDLTDFIVNFLLWGAGKTP
jgi:hypothetical protein